MTVAHGAPRPAGRKVPNGAGLVEPGEIADAGEEEAVVAIGAGRAEGVVRRAELEALDGEAPPPASRAEAPDNRTQPTKTGPADTPGTGPAAGRAGVS
jgi:hypothetical protein